MLRNLFKSDLKQVLAIEESVHVVPWTEDTFKICFQSGYIGWVLEINKNIIGFIIISLRAEECHILNLCVARSYQRQGYGKKLLLHVLQHAKQAHANIAYLEVRRSNQSAIALYKKIKFHLVGERKNYYTTISGSEDALIFARTLEEDIKT